MWQFAPALSRSLPCCFSPNDAYVLLSLANAHMYLWCLRDNAVEKEFAVAGEAEKEGLEEAEEVCEEVGGGGGSDPFVNQSDGECKR